MNDSQNYDPFDTEMEIVNLKYELEVTRAKLVTMQEELERLMNIVYDFQNIYGEFDKHICNELTHIHYRINQYLAKPNRTMLICGRDDSDESDIP